MYVSPKILDCSPFIKNLILVTSFSWVRVFKVLFIILNFCVSSLKFSNSFEKLIVTQLFSNCVEITFVFSGNIVNRFSESGPFNNNSINFWYGFCISNVESINFDSDFKLFSESTKNKFTLVSLNCFVLISSSFPLIIFIL